MDKVFTFIELYGPHDDHVSLWTLLYEKSLLRSANQILGGDLNLFLGDVESWGSRVRMDSLTNLFTIKYQSII